MKLNKKANHLIYVIYFLIAFIGSYLVFRSMTWGPWAFSDSSAYVSAARNFASGNGFVVYQSTGEVKILKEFPPFFPVLLSIFGGSKLDYISTIRWLNIFLFSSSIFLFSQVLYITTRKHYLSVIAALFFISSPQIIATYTSAMSEPLFLFLVLLSLFLLQLSFIKDKNILQFFFIVSSLIPITRYAGVLFVGIFGTSLFINSRNVPLIIKIRNTALYYLIAFLPLGLWGASLFYKFNSFGGRRFSLGNTFISNFAKNIGEELKILKQWIPYVKIYLDTPTETIIISIAAIFIISLIGWAIKEFLFSHIANKSNQKHFFFLIIILIFGYISFIGLTHSIVIPQIPHNDRMLIPIYPLCIFVFFLSVDALIDKIGQENLLIVFIVALSFLGLRYNFLRTNSYIKNMEENGHGSTARAYQQSGLIKEIQKLSIDQEIISNSSGFILFYTNRYPMQVYNFPNYAYGSGNSYGEKSFRENNAALIFLFSDFSNYYGKKSESLLYSLTNTLNAKYIDNEGGIYYFQ